MIPSEIIKESRVLEGVSVDLGDDDGDDEFLASRLKHYASIINQATSISLEIAKTIDRYNTVLYVYLITLEFNQRVLDEDGVIPEKYILIAYLEHIEELKNNGPFTFDQKLKNIDYIGVIEVSLLSKKNPLTISEIESFKGSTKEKVKIYTGWGNEYERNQQYLVLWKDEEVVAMNSSQRMPVIKQGDSTVVICQMASHLVPFTSQKHSEYESVFKLSDFRTWYQDWNSKFKT